MRISILSALAGMIALLSVSAFAPTVKGMFLITDYPAVTAQPGTTSTIRLLGGGQPVAAAMPATDANVALQPRLDIPASAGTGSPTLTVNAEGKDAGVELPITVTLAKELPAKLKLNAALPALRESAKSSFDYQLSINNIADAT